MLAVHKSTLSAAGCAHRRNFVLGTTSSSLSSSSRRETSHGSSAVTVPSRRNLRRRQTSLLNRDVSIRPAEPWKSPCVFVKRQKERREREREKLVLSGYVASVRWVVCFNSRNFTSQIHQGKPRVNQNNPNEILQLVAQPCFLKSWRRPFIYLALLREMEFFFIRTNAYKAMRVRFNRAASRFGVFENVFVTRPSSKRGKLCAKFLACYTSRDAIFIQNSRILSRHNSLDSRRLITTLIIVRPKALTTLHACRTSRRPGRHAEEHPSLHVDAKRT